MMRLMPAPGPDTRGAVQMILAGDASNDASAAPEYTTTLPQSLCPRCGSPGPHRIKPGAGPHYQRLLCGQCGAYIRWLPKPRQLPMMGVQP